MRAPWATIDYLHADQPKRFGLEPVIEHLARTADAPTARFALRRMEFRSTSVTFRGPSLPLVPILTAIALAGAGVGVAWAFVAMSETERKSSDGALTGGLRKILRSNRRHEPLTVSTPRCR